MRLFHFSDDPGIEHFVPRSVRIASVRPSGRDWLDGPLVWAIDEAHEPMYLFPRDCPRLLVWAVEDTTAADRDRWLGTAPFAAYVEHARLGELEAAMIHRYELPPASFVSLEDAGMWVSRDAVRPLGRDRISDLPAALARRGVALRTVEDFGLLPALRATSLHVSAIRLRNARPMSAEAP